MHYKDPNNEFFSTTHNSCNHPETNEIIYQIINDFVENSSLKIDIVISELNTIHSYRELIKENERYPAPPSYGTIYYDKDFFENLYKEALISKNDVDYMYDQIKNLSIKLDRNKIRPKTIGIREYVSGMRDSVGNVIKNFNFPYQGKSVCRFSNPIFSSNKKIALISIWTSKYQGGFDWDNYKNSSFKNRKWKMENGKFIT